MIRLTIDGQEIEVREGTMIADAAARLGIDIPVYCYHEALGPLGACRMCLVQVEKMPKLATACTTAVAEGMVVHTTGPQVDKGRKGVLEFLLINHPLDCPVCDKGGECFLQDYTFRYGPPQGRFQEPKIQKVKDGPISDLILIDQERCVLCQRCVRFMDEYVGEPELLLEGRGVETVVTTVEGRPAQSQFAGNVIDLCPVGALLAAPYHHKARPWNIEREESVCTLCPVGCTTLTTGRDGRIVRVEGRPVVDRNWGWLCDRGRFGFDFATHPSRLVNSRLHGREEAAARTTREIGQWLREVVAQEGGEAIAVVMGGLHTTEEAHQVYRFATEVLGTRRLVVSRDVPGYVPRGLNGTFEDLSAADAVILVGTDPYESAPVLHLRLRERLKNRRAPLTLMGVAPRNLSRSTLPVETLVTHVGQEADVLAAALKEAAGDHPAVAALLSQGAGIARGIDPTQVSQLSRVLREAERLVVVWDGVEPDVEHVLAALAQARQGQTTRVLPTFGPSNWRGFERAGFDARFDALTRVLEDARDGKIRMLILWGADLLKDYPDRRLVEQAYERVEWLLAEGVFVPEGAEHFDAVVPGAAPGEVYGTYVNMEARLQIASPSVNPPGQARPTKSYLTAWAHALGKPFVVDEEWDPYDDASGDLLPEEPLPQDIEAIRAPDLPEGGVELLVSAQVWANGIPSQILEARLEAAQIARISPLDADALGIREVGVIRVESAEGVLELPVRVDEHLTPGRLLVPLGVGALPVNRLRPGVVKVQRLEEVQTP
ncbi:MAG: 2Fe-2S iron-sulfur cluster-binding protein [Firmicutes bacterium]|nr:2Fe-2S iron-sulfur cluster-binding protein [Bacillota bacterium]